MGLCTQYQDREIEWLEADGQLILPTHQIPGISRFVLRA